LREINLPNSFLLVYLRFSLFSLIVSPADEGWGSRCKLQEPECQGEAKNSGQGLRSPPPPPAGTAASPKCPLRIQYVICHPGFNSQAAIQPKTPSSDRKSMCSQSRSRSALTAGPRNRLSRTRNRPVALVLRQLPGIIKRQHEPYPPSNHGNFQET
jgi:hypothetical protein